VYDYTAGKADWLAHNQPVEGEHANLATAGRVARQDVVTCRLDDRVGSVRERIERSPYGFGLVTTEGGVLLGRLRRSALDCDPGLPAGDVMEPGPTTVRADERAGKLAQRLADRGWHWAIVSTPEGRLIGVAGREELERAESQQG